MRSFAIAALAAFVAVALARTGLEARMALESRNISTFVDPATNQTIRHFDCDVGLESHSSKHFNDTIRKLHKISRRPNVGGSRLGASKRQTVATPITAPVYIHLITTTAKAGTLTQDTATQQVATLNTAYNVIGVTFTLAGVTTTANDTWATANIGDPSIDEMKAVLRQGTYSTLNLYFHTDFGGGVLGTCTLPSQVTNSSDPSQYVSDGCNVNANTMPGGSMDGYNQGMTAVHETGHWLGLLHTFEGYSCTGDGDLVDDTPVESESTDGCPTKPVKDSCPSATGVDPIHNYMDYSSDACYEAFTAGQVTRISNLWTQYRQGM